MKFWALSRTGPIGYDEYDGFVVRAATAQEAIDIVAKQHHRRSWQAIELSVEGPAEIVFESFNAG